MASELPEPFAGLLKARLELAGVRVVSEQVSAVHRRWVVKAPDRYLQLKQYLPAAARLGLDTNWIARVHRVAGQAGLAPGVVFWDPGEQLLCCEWLDAPSWSCEEAADPNGRLRLQACLDRVCALEISNPWQRDLKATAGRYAGLVGHANRSEAVRLVESLQAALPAIPTAKPCLQHFDPHPGNVLGHEPWLIDWDYAAMGHPATDETMLALYCGHDASVSPLAEALEALNRLWELAVRQLEQAGH